MSTVAIAKDSGQMASSQSSGNREFVENWNFAQTLGEGAYGE